MTISAINSSVKHFQALGGIQVVDLPQLVTVGENRVAHVRRCPLVVGMVIFSNISTDHHMKSLLASLRIMFEAPFHHDHQSMECCFRELAVEVRRSSLAARRYHHSARFLSGGWGLSSPRELNTPWYSTGAVVITLAN